MRWSRSIRGWLNELCFTIGSASSRGQKLRFHELRGVTQEAGREEEAILCNIWLAKFSKGGGGGEIMAYPPPPLNAPLKLVCRPS